MDHHTIDVFLFDLGSVILPFNHYQIAEKLARFSERKELSDPSRIFSYLFDRQNGAVNDYETGKMKDQKEIQMALEIWSLINKLSNFL